MRLSATPPLHHEDRKPVADWDVRYIRFIVTDWPERDRRHGDGGYGWGL